MLLSDILQIEKHAEDAFMTVLLPALPANPDGTKNLYRTRGDRTAESPRVEIAVILGEVKKDHEHIFTNGASIYDSWDAELQMVITTNRTSVAPFPTHAELLGKVRALLQRCVLVAQPPGSSTWPNRIVLLVDIREQGTTDSWESGDNLDSSAISYYLFLQVSQEPGIWPALPY